ncbi:hypothetical protein ACWDKQ_09575 [Saccharopolyspora sp. NPDC000995]
MLSIGGGKGIVDLGSEANVANIVDSVGKILTNYGINTLDIDSTELNTPNTTSAIRQLHERVGDNFVPTMAPQTLDVQPDDSYMQLFDNVKDSLKVVHTQYYNSGPINGCNGQDSVDFITAQACSPLKVLHPDQVSLGLPTAASAAAADTSIR